MNNVPTSCGLAGEQSTSDVSARPVSEEFDMEFSCTVKQWTEWFPIDRDKALRKYLRKIAVRRGLTETPSAFRSPIVCGWSNVLENCPLLLVERSGLGLYLRFMELWRGHTL